MKNYLLGGAAALIGLMGAGVAGAADLPARTGPVPAPVMYSTMFSWTGFYAGVNAGYHFHDNKATTTGTPAFVALGTLVPGSLATGKDGFIGGGQIGYNYQFGAVVAGVEADLQYVDGKRATVFTNGPVATGAGSGLEYLGTVRARLGYVPMDRLMIYVTGGLAYGNPQNTAVVTTVAPLPAGLWAGSSDNTRFGYTIGGGVEYALTNNWTAKVEYLYYDLGRQSVTAGPVNAATAAAFPGVAYQARFQNNGSIVRGGVNYKF
jgi:outer membrane immunogenic protein